MSTIVEDYSPISVGDTGSMLAPSFQYANGKPVDLTGATISMKMKNKDTGTIKTCNAPWNIDDYTGGKAHYQYEASDIDTSGIWELEITITIGGKPQHTDVRTLEIKSVF